MLRLPPLYDLLSGATVAAAAAAAAAASALLLLIQMLLQCRHTCDLKSGVQGSRTDTSSSDVLPAAATLLLPAVYTHLQLHILNDCLHDGGQPGGDGLLSE